MIDYDLLLAVVKAAAFFSMGMLLVVALMPRRPREVEVGMRVRCGPDRVMDIVVTGAEPTVEGVLAEVTRRLAGGDTVVADARPATDRTPVPTG